MCSTIFTREELQMNLRKCIQDAFHNPSPKTFALYRTALYVLRSYEKKHGYR